MLRPYREGIQELHHGGLIVEMIDDMGGAQQVAHPGPAGTSLMSMWRAGSFVMMRL